MQCSIGISARDQGTAHVADLLDEPLMQLGRALSNNYGGVMENLWIDIELCPAQADRRGPWKFRFQRSVAPSRILPAALKMSHTPNVGHYSIRPDFFELAKVPMTEVVCFMMRLLYESTSVLRENSERLGFDFDAFDADFRSALQRLGCFT